MSKINEKIIDSISKIINENEELIERNYRDKKDQILFSRDLVEKIYHIVEDFTQDAKDAKELLKYAIKKILNLNESDVVISKNGHYFIKLFDATKKKDSSQERRFDGISEQELKSFYDEFFSEEVNTKIFQLIAKEFVDTLDNEKITNERYEQKVFKDIQAMICKYLTEKYDNSEEFFYGFSGYYFRIHFENVFESIADFILCEVANVNEYITEFIKYYSVNILVLNGKKYRVPSIETNDGANWTTTSILSISKKHFGAIEYKKAIEADIETLEEERSKYLVNGISPIKHQQNSAKQIQDLEFELSKQNKELNICSDSLDLEKDDANKKELKDKTAYLKNEIQELENKIEQVHRKNVKDSTIEKYKKSQKELDVKMRDLKNKERTMNQNTNLYNSMRASFVKALISKKKLM